MNDENVLIWFWFIKENFFWPSGALKAINEESWTVDTTGPYPFIGGLPTQPPAEVTA